MGAAGRPAASTPFGPEGEFVARSIAAGGGGGKPEVRFGTGGAVVGAAGGAWPEAVAVLVGAGGASGAAAAEKLLRFY